MAKRQRHPVARIRAAIAGVDLFFPNKSKTKRRKMTRKFLRRTREYRDFDVFDKLGTISEAGTVADRLLRMIVIGTKEGLKRKSTLLHELSHFFRVGRNDMLTANALVGYIKRMQGEFIPNPERPPSYWLEQIERITRSPFYRRWLLKDRAYEHEKGIGGLLGGTINTIGMNLGAFAVEKEKQWKKPASGLFLIREVCNGKAVDAAVKEIESGKFDKEIKAFAKKHFANLFPKNK